MKIKKIAKLFLKLASDIMDANLIDLNAYRNAGYDMSWIMKLSPAKSGEALGGMKYPENYKGKFNDDGSGLPFGFDDDGIKIDRDMIINNNGKKDFSNVDRFVKAYFMNVNPDKLAEEASYLASLGFRASAQILLNKGDYIKNNSK
jgi:hypothetical protein